MNNSKKYPCHYCGRMVPKRSCVPIETNTAIVSACKKCARKRVSRIWSGWKPPTKLKPLVRLKLNKMH